MKIEDHRNNLIWVPALEILNEFIPKINQKYFIGIKKIILLDLDYHKDKKRRAAARYVPVRGTKMANIELYFNSFNDYPEVAKKSEMYITWTILLSLAHELYHHRVRGQKMIRRPKFDTEQKNATKWALKIIKPLFYKKFPMEKYEQESKHIEHQFRLQQNSNKSLESDA